MSTSNARPRLSALILHEFRNARTRRTGLDRHFSGSNRATLNNRLATPSANIHTPSLPVNQAHGLQEQHCKYESSVIESSRLLEARRTFSSTSARGATVVKANARKDDDGNEMLVEITPRASNVCALACAVSFALPVLTSPQRLREIMTKDSNPNLALRVTVESGGCHGFQYLMSLTNTSAISQEEDTVFEVTDGSGARVVMDEPSLELLKGSKVDFTMELIGSQFKIVGNPAATSSCGCGTSFDIKP